MGDTIGTVTELPAELHGCRVIERRFTAADIERLARADRDLLAASTSKRSCIAKRQISQRRARRDARCLRDRGEQVHAYACDRCGGWHVGHEPVAHVPVPSPAAPRPARRHVTTCPSRAGRAGCAGRAATRP